ncbi:MAG: hypothetical protein PHN39_01040 [Candidatus Pacebacteria bacterium]|nr:hypothetical protein [Candidatus Paceibacterota bacterium]
MVPNNINNLKSPKEVSAILDNNEFSVGQEVKIKTKKGRVDAGWEIVQREGDSFSLAKRNDKGILDINRVLKLSREELLGANPEVGFQQEINTLEQEVLVNQEAIHDRLTNFQTEGDQMEGVIQKADTLTDKEKAGGSETIKEASKEAEKEATDATLALENLKTKRETAEFRLGDQVAIKEKDHVDSGWDIIDFPENKSKQAKYRGRELVRVQKMVQGRMEYRDISKDKLDELNPYTPAPKEPVKFEEKKAELVDLAQKFEAGSVLSLKDRIFLGEKTKDLEISPEIAQSLKDTVIKSLLETKSKKGDEVGTIDEMVQTLKKSGYFNNSDAEVKKDCEQIYYALKASIVQEASQTTTLRAVNTGLITGIKAGGYFLIGGITSAALTPAVGLAITGGVRMLDTFLTNKFGKERQIKKHKEQLAQSGTDGLTNDLLMLVASAKRRQLVESKVGSMGPADQEQQQIDGYTERALNLLNYGPKAKGVEDQFKNLSTTEKEQLAQLTASVYAMDDKIQRRVEEVAEAKKEGRFSRWAKAVANAKCFKLMNPTKWDELSRGITLNAATLAVATASLQQPFLRALSGFYGGIRLGMAAERFIGASKTPERALQQSFAELQGLNPKENLADYRDRIIEIRAALNQIKITDKNRISIEKQRQTLSEHEFKLANELMLQKSEASLQDRFREFYGSAEQEEAEEGLKKEQKTNTKRKWTFRILGGAAGALFGLELANHAVAAMESRASQAGSVGDSLATHTPPEVHTGSPETNIIPEHPPVSSPSSQETLKNIPLSTRPTHQVVEHLPVRPANASQEVPRTTTSRIATPDDDYLTKNPPYKPPSEVHRVTEVVSTSTGAKAGQGAKAAEVAASVAKSAEHVPLSPMSNREIGNTINMLKGWGFDVDKWDNVHPGNEIILSDAHGNVIEKITIQKGDNWWDVIRHHPNSFKNADFSKIELYKGSASLEPSDLDQPTRGLGGALKEEIPGGIKVSPKGGESILDTQGGGGQKDVDLGAGAKASPPLEKPVESGRSPKPFIDYQVEHHPQQPTRVEHDYKDIPYAQRDAIAEIERRHAPPIGSEIEPPSKSFSQDVADYIRIHQSELPKEMLTGQKISIQLNQIGSNLNEIKEFIANSDSLTQEVIKENIAKLVSLEEASSGLDLIDLKKHLDYVDDILVKNFAVPKDRLADLIYLDNLGKKNSGTWNHDQLMQFKILFNQRKSVQEYLSDYLLRLQQYKTFFTSMAKSSIAKIPGPGGEVSHGL